MNSEYIIMVIFVLGVLLILKYFKAIVFSIFIVTLVFILQSQFNVKQIFSDLRLRLTSMAARYLKTAHPEILNNFNWKGINLNER